MGCLLFWMQIQCTFFLKKIFNWDNCDLFCLKIYDVLYKKFKSFRKKKSCQSSTKNSIWEKWNPCKTIKEMMLICIFQENAQPQAEFYIQAIKDQSNWSSQKLFSIFYYWCLRFFDSKLPKQSCLPHFFIPQILKSTKKYWTKK